MERSKSFLFVLFSPSANSPKSANGQIKTPEFCTRDDSDHLICKLFKVYISKHLLRLLRKKKNPSKASLDYPPLNMANWVGDYSFKLAWNELKRQEDSGIYILYSLQSRDWRVRSLVNVPR